MTCFTNNGLIYYYPILSFVHQNVALSSRKKWNQKGRNKKQHFDTELLKPNTNDNPYSFVSTFKICAHALFCVIKISVLFNLLYILILCVCFVLFFLDLCLFCSSLICVCFVLPWSESVLFCSSLICVCFVFPWSVSVLFFLDLRLFCFVLPCSVCFSLF